MQPFLPPYSLRPFCVIKTVGGVLGGGMLSRRDWGVHAHRWSALPKSVGGYKRAPLCLSVLPIWKAVSQKSYPINNVHRTSHPLHAIKPPPHYRSPTAGRDVQG